MMSKRLAVLTVAGVLTLLGCASTPKAQPTGLLPEAFWKEQQSRLTDTRQMTSRVFFHYENKKTSLGGQGRLVLQAPNALRMELRDPLGRLQYVATLQERQFVARYPRQSLAYLDQESGAAYLRRVLGIHVSFGELKDLLIGVVPQTLRKAKFDSWRWSDEGVYVGTFKLKDRRIEAGVDPHQATLVWLKVDADRPSDRAVIRYADFDSCCKLEGNGRSSDFPLAHNVSLQMSETGTTVSLEWQDVQSYREPKPAEIFKAELPEPTKKVQLN